jgi:hypothetical protein
MDRALLAGVGLSCLGVVGYVVGTHVAYSGRAFSITALMAGITLVAIARRPGAGVER